MLPPTIVCAVCHRGSPGHDRFGNCTSLLRTRQAAPMTPEGYAAMRGIVRKFEEAHR